MEVTYGDDNQQALGQLTDGTVVRQLFKAESWHLAGVSIPFSTFGMDYPGRVLVQIIDLSQTILGEAYLNTSDIVENSWNEFPVDVMMVQGGSYEVKMFTQNCRSGMSSSLRHGLKKHDGHFFVGSKLMHHTELSCQFRYHESTTSNP